MNLRLPGQQADATGFYRNGFRTYNPALGRYLESDLIGLMGGLNTYIYGRNNPMKFTDQLGLCPSQYANDCVDESYGVDFVMGVAGAIMTL